MNRNGELVYPAELKDKAGVITDAHKPAYTQRVAGQQNTPAAVIELTPVGQKWMAAKQGSNYYVEIGRAHV